jgi:hypothetical protein
MKEPLMSIFSKFMSIFSNMSAREKNLWSELLVDVLVAVYYFPNAFRLIHKGRGAINNPAMAGLVIMSIVIAVFVSIVMSIVLRVWREPNIKDERDYQFMSRGAIIAYWTLLVFIGMIIGQLAFEGLYPGIAERIWITTTPIIIAHLLMLSWMFSSVIKTSIQLFFYRRGC